jgi:hypothetical protein
VSKCGHPSTSFYATRMADPRGVAVQGVHFECEECDKERRATFDAGYRAAPFPYRHRMADGRRAYLTWDDTTGTVLVCEPAELIVR